MNSHVCMMQGAAVAAKERETEAEGGSCLLTRAAWAGLGHGLLGCLCLVPWGHLAEPQSHLWS